MFGLRYSALICLLPVGAWGQFSEHSTRLDREFANLHSLSDSVPGVLIKGVGDRAATVRGIVRKSNGEVAGGAEVWAYGFRGNRIPCRELTTTDKQGRFTLRLPVSKRLGNVNWGISVFHGLESSAAENLGPDKKAAGIVHLRPRRTVLLSVTTEKGQPVSEFRIYTDDGRVLDHVGPEPMKIHGLKNGVHSMCILAVGFAREVLHVDTTAVDPTLLEVRLARGRTISGTIRDKAGEPLPDSGVRRFFGNQITQAARTVLADENGRYRYAGARRSSQRFMAFPCRGGGDVEYLDVPFGLADVDGADGLLPTAAVAAVAAGGIAMLGGGGPDSETGAVSGHVLDPQGKPVRSFTIRLDIPRKQPEGMQLGGYAAVYSSVGFRVTDARGRFRVTDIDRNRAIRLTASVTGYRDGFVDVVRTVDASAKPSFGDAALRLQKATGVEIRAQNDSNKIDWVLLASRPERDTHSAAHYIQAGARQSRGNRIDAGRIVFKSVEFNDGLLAAIRGKQVAVTPWRGQASVTVDVDSLDWVTTGQ